MASIDPRGISHLVILGHPAPDSFCHAIAEAYCESVQGCGQSAVLRDLYAMGFDPLLKAQERPSTRDFQPAADVAAELDLIRASQVVTLVYPIWFGMPPAIIKGYVDRVLGAGFMARDIKAGAPNPLLYGKRLVILSSSASSLPWLEEQGQWVSLRQAFDTYLTTIFSLKSCDHLHFDAVVDGMTEQRFRENLGLVDDQARKTSSGVLAEIHATEILALREPRIP